MKSRKNGFSLVEVVVAVGIFSLAVVSVLGVLAATSKSISDTNDSDYAIRLISLIQPGLQEEYNRLALQKGADDAYDDFVSYIDNSNADAILYANRAGDKIGVAKTTRWKDGAWVDLWTEEEVTSASNNTVSINKKRPFMFFEIRLIENDGLKSKVDLQSANPKEPIIPFFVKIAWPAYDATGAEQNETQRNALILPVAIVR